MRNLSGKKPKYVATQIYFYGCPHCDDNRPDDLLFFYSLKEIIRYQMERYGEYQLTNVYSVSGNLLFEVEWNTNQHSLRDIVFSIKGKRFLITNHQTLDCVKTGRTSNHIHLYRI